MSHMNMIVPYDYWFYTPVSFRVDFFRFMCGTSLFTTFHRVWLQPGHDRNDGIMMGFIGLNMVQWIGLR